MVEIDLDDKTRATYGAIEASDVKDVSIAGADLRSIVDHRDWREGSHLEPTYLRLSLKDGGSSAAN